MGQRLIEPGYVALTNPGFMTRRGFMINIVGSDNDDDEEDDGENEGGEGDEGEDHSEGDKDGEGDKEAAKKVTPEEYERLQNRMKAADKNQADLQKRLKEFEDKDKDEKTKATERVEELETSVKERDTEISSLRLQNAFLSSNDVTWDDPEYALDFAERKGYLEDVRDDDGNIDSKELIKALKKLSTDKPAMVKKADDDQGPPGTGDGVGTQKRKKTEVDEEALRRKYPAAFH